LTIKLLKFYNCFNIPKQLEHIETLSKYSGLVFFFLNKKFYCKREEKTVHRKCTEQNNTTQAIEESKKSKTEEEETTPAALDQSIRVRRTVPLTSIRFLSFPSKLLEFLSHQNTQGGTMSHNFLILMLWQLSPQQDKRSRTPPGMTHWMPKMLKV
jgi:hypothetical protein